jgi:hypothetical protein
MDVKPIAVFLTYEFHERLSVRVVSLFRVGVAAWWNIDFPRVPENRSGFALF